MAYLYLALMMFGKIEPGYQHERVWRCHDQWVDTGQRTPKGHRVIRLERTGCYWSAIDLPTRTEKRCEYRDEDSTEE